MKKGGIDARRRNSRRRPRGGTRGGDRGWSATRVRRSRAERGKRWRDCGWIRLPVSGLGKKLGFQGGF
jgi:hypothetical protein